MQQNSMVSIMSTLQQVQMWTNFAAYLIRQSNRIWCIGKKLQHLKHDLHNVTRQQKDCSLLLRAQRATHQKVQNLQRVQRRALIAQIIEDNDCQSLWEFTNCLTKQDRWELYDEFGNLWKETTELCIDAYVEELRHHQETTPFQLYIQENQHRRTCVHPSDTTTGEQWIDKLFEVNKINKRKFLQDLTSIMNKSIHGINTFVIEGPTRTGKYIFLLIPPLP